MSGAQRREQLILIARSVFAERGFEGTSIEEIAQRADVSKPVVYEHFGGKEGLYAVVVDREVRTLLDSIRAALTTPRAGSRELIERGALALLDYIDECPDGFQILARDGASAGSFATILSDIGGQVEDLLAAPFERHGFNREFAGLYARALVGLVAMAGQSWLDDRKQPKEEVAAHLVNLAWNGMRNLEVDPAITTRDPHPSHPEK